MNISIKDILFPRRCPVCGEITVPPGSLICPECISSLSFVTSPVCKCCGKEVESSRIEYCSDCRKHPHTFISGAALFNYNDTARNSMSAIKYKNKKEYLDFYGAAMAERFRTQILAMHADALVPVPVHPDRKRKRGFNQAEVLSRIIGKELSIPVCDILRRTKKTIPQKELTATERLRNLSDAIRSEKLPDGLKSFIIVDDIYTTGSTIEASARALRARGADRIYFLTACIGGGR